MQSAAAMEVRDEEQALSLGIGLEFDDLYSLDGLARLDQAFLDKLHVVNHDLYERLVTARADPAAIDRLQCSQLILDLAPYLEGFIGELFKIEAELHELQAQHSTHAKLFALKRKFVQRRGASGLTAEAAAAIDGPGLGAQLERLFGE
ncbi:MAG: hypothetical protein ACLP00_18945, partial [Terracidiphilus sp.]